jgi:hypothetical protein
MDTEQKTPVSGDCGAECGCHAQKGPARRWKLIILFIIVTAAAAALIHSISKKSSAPDPACTPVCAPSGVAALSSLASLNTQAQNFDGVFLLVTANPAEKTPGLEKEIGAAIASIGSRGVRMGSFQLSLEAPDYAMITAQMPPPCVLVLVKGKGMRGVPGNEVNQNRLLQAFLSAQQPSSCCPAGGQKVCK